MNGFDDLTLMAYVLGDLPPTQRAMVDEHAAHNPELSAKLAVLTSGFGLNVPSVAELATRHSSPRGRRSRLGKSLAASIVASALVGTAAYAGYELLHDKPLLEDNFRDEWLDTRIWNTYRGRKGIREEGGQLRLLNRGSIVSHQQFEGPIEIELDWQWLDLTSDPLYPDTLHIGLRTSGRHENEHSFRLLDGVEVAFQPHAGTVAVNPALEKIERKRISPIGELKFAAGKWYHLRITDDGQRIAVYVSGPEIDRKYTKEPALAVDIVGEYAEHRVAFFNREYLAGANHESRIDNVVIRKLPQP